MESETRATLHGYYEFKIVKSRTSSRFVPGKPGVGCSKLDFGKNGIVLQIHLSILKVVIHVLRDFTDTPFETKLYSFVGKGRMRVASSSVKL